MNQPIPILTLALLAMPLSATAQSASIKGAKPAPALSVDSPVETLRPRAEAGDPAAMFYLGAKYSDGRGVARDEAEGLRWYRKVAERGNSGAMLNIGNSYYNGRGVPEDRVEAARWFRRAADRGHAGAMYNLAICYASGQGIDKDETEAVKWFRASAAKGNPRAMAALSSRGLGL